MKKYIINLKTDRLLLRNIKPEDKSFLLDLWTDPYVTEYMGGPRDLKSLNPALDENIKNPFTEEYDLWVLTEKSTSEPVGHCGLLKKKIKDISEIEIIYVIAEKYQGKGYASEIAAGIADYAFREKKLSSITALIKPGNTVSEKVAVKIGMYLENKIIRSGDTEMLLYRLKKSIEF